MITDDKRKEILDFIINKNKMFDFKLEHLLYAIVRTSENDGRDFVTFLHVNKFKDYGIMCNTLYFCTKYSYSNKDTLVYENLKYKKRNMYINKDGKSLLSWFVYKTEFVAENLRTNKISDSQYKLDNSQLNFEVIDNL